MKADSSYQWISERHAEYICPNKLKSYKKGYFTMEIDEDQVLMNKRRETWLAI
jgi:hypothetical protein